MSDMVPLMQYVVQQLKTVHNRVYLEQAPDDPVFPYVVYQMPTSNEMENREDFSIEVNIWGNSLDTLEIEQLTSNIDRRLNRLSHYDNGFQTILYRINRMMIPDPEPSIRRRQLRYQAQTYMKG